MDNKKITPITRINKFFSEEDFNLEISMVVYKTTNLVNGRVYVGQDSKNNPDYLGSGTIIMNLVQIGLIYGCSNKIIHKFIKKHKDGE